MEKENILFKTSSTFQKFANLLIRLFCLIVVIDAAIHFNENRILTSIIITLFFIGFLLVNDKSIIVYSNYIEFNYKCIVPYMLTPIKIYFDDIESIDTKFRLSFGHDFITFICSFIPSVNSFNTLIITQKRGGTRTIVTQVYKDEIINALKIVEEQTNNKIKIIYN